MSNLYLVLWLERAISKHDGPKKAVCSCCASRANAEEREIVDFSTNYNSERYKGEDKNIEGE